MPITGYDHVALPAKNPEALIAFYKEVAPEKAEDVEEGEKVTGRVVTEKNAERPDCGETINPGGSALFSYIATNEVT